MTKPLAPIARDPTLRLIVAILFLFGGSASAIAPYQALIGIGVYGLPDWAWSLVMLSSSLVAVASSVSFGIVTDQLDSRRPAVVACALLAIAGGLLVWFADTPAAFLLVHILFWPAAGTLFGQLFTLARPAARRYDKAEREPLIATVRALFALAFVFALPLWSAAFAAGAPLRIVYPVIAAIGAAILAITAVFWSPNMSAELRAERSGLSFFAALSQVVAVPILARVLLLSAITSANVLYMSMMGLLFAAAPGRDFSDAALFLMCVTALEVPLMIAAGSWVGRFGKVRLITFGGLFYAGFLLAYVLLISSPAIWFMALPAALGAALILSVPIGYLQDLLADRPGAGGSLLAVNQVTGFGIAAALFALGTAVGTYTTVAVLGAAVTALASLALARLEIRAGKWGH